jgi:hypothetical protein
VRRLKPSLTSDSPRPQLLRQLCDVHSQQPGLILHAADIAAPCAVTWRAVYLPQIKWAIDRKVGTSLSRTAEAVRSPRLDSGFRCRVGLFGAPGR